MLRRPPPAAYEACVEQQEGASCIVDFHEREIKGSCVLDVDDALFCLPEEPPPPPPGSHGDGRGPTL